MASMSRAAAVRSARAARETLQPKVMHKAGHMEELPELGEDSAAAALKFPKAEFSDSEVQQDPNEGQQHRSARVPLRLADLLSCSSDEDQLEVDDKFDEVVEAFVDQWEKQRVVFEMGGMELTDFGVHQETAGRRARAAPEAEFNDLKKDADDAKAECNVTGLAACRTRGERRGRKNKGKTDLKRGVKTDFRSEERGEVHTSSIRWFCSHCQACNGMWRQACRCCQVPR